MALWSWHLAGDLRIGGSNPGGGKTPMGQTLTGLSSDTSGNL